MRETNTVSPELLSRENVSGAEEGDAREAQVLVQHEHAYGDEVGVTQVVYEAADVPIVTGVNTVHFTVLPKRVITVNTTITNISASSNNVYKKYKY